MDPRLPLDTPLDPMQSLVVQIKFSCSLSLSLSLNAKRHSKLRWPDSLPIWHASVQYYWHLRTWMKISNYTNMLKINRKFKGTSILVSLPIRIPGELFPRHSGIGANPWREQRTCKNRERTLSTCFTMQSHYSETWQRNVTMKSSQLSNKATVSF